MIHVIHEFSIESVTLCSAESLHTSRNLDIRPDNHRSRNSPVRQASGVSPSSRKDHQKFTHRIGPEEWTAFRMVYLIAADSSNPSGEQSPEYVNLFPNNPPVIRLSPRVLICVCV